MVRQAEGVMAIAARTAFLNSAAMFNATALNTAGLNVAASSAALRSSYALKGRSCRISAGLQTGSRFGRSAAAMLSRERASGQGALRARAETEPAESATLDAVSAEQEVVEVAGRAGTEKRAHSPKASDVSGAGSEAFDILDTANPFAPQPFVEFAGAVDFEVGGYEVFSDGADISTHPAVEYLDGAGPAELLVHEAAAFSHAHEWMLHALPIVLPEAGVVFPGAQAFERGVGSTIMFEPDFAWAMDAALAAGGADSIRGRLSRTPETGAAVAGRNGARKTQQADHERGPAGIAGRHPKATGVNAGERVVESAGGLDDVVEDIPFGVTIGVTAVVARHDGHVVMEQRFGEIAVQRHFVVHEGRLVYAGWERARDGSAHALESVRDAGRRAPDPLHSDGLTVLGLGQAGGESAFAREPLVIDDPEVVEMLSDLLMTQLRAGPASLEGGELLAQFNSFVRARLSNGSSAPHTREEWEAYLRETIALSVRFSLPLDERGARSLEEMQADAARILGIDGVRYMEWEEHFGEDFVSSQIFSPDGGIEADPDTPKGRLFAAFEGHMARLAERRLGRRPFDPGVSFSDEADLQWSVVRAAMIGGRAERVDYALRMIAELRGQGRRSMASRALAHLFRLSDASEYAPRSMKRLSKQEIAAVIAGLMNDDTWDVVSHRSFRMQLAPAENEYVNRVAERASSDNAVSALRAIDLKTATDDEFWGALEGSGQASAILDNVIAKMAYMATPAIVDASFSDEPN